MTISIKGVAVLSLACIAVDVFAAFVPESDVRRAAEAFVATDAIGSSVLSGRSVVGVSKRDGLWIVALAPSGHVIFSGSDLVDPIVGFSKNNFVEPDPESPAFAVLDGANASVVTAEAQGAGTRHARWTKLLGGMAKKGLLKAADVESPDTIVIPPFIESHYNQCQPYNDYAPVHEASTNDLGAYRGRCPCGCVATAAAQGFRHFRWPVRMDRVDSFNHNFTDANNLTTPFPLRFDGNVPINWDALEDDYASDAGGEWIPDPERPGTGWSIWKTFTDLRGTVPEATRHPISRLIMLVDVLAHMSFGVDGSSANYGTVAANASDWYTQGTWVSPTDARVQADIMNGVPVQVTIPGHAVVGHGWANDGSNTYIYLNYGWGDSNDGYYNINGTTMQEAYVGHYPRAKPQIDPLPKVCETNVTINWHFPDFYTNKLSGFTVLVSKTATTTSTFLDDFSDTSGISDIENGSINDGELDRIYVATDSKYGSGCGNLLYVEPLAFGHFTYTDKLTLTDSSTLSFRLRSINANACVYEIQARYNDGDWTNVDVPPLSTTPNGYTVDSGWQVRQVELIGHSGETAQFRINKEYVWDADYYENGLILLDDFSVSNVLQQEAPTAFPVDADKRSCEITGLDAGSTYSFTVKPIMSGALVEAERSDPTVTTTAGEILVPVESETTVVVTNSPVFSAVDATGIWSYTGTAQADKKSVKDKSSCSITANLPGVLTADSVLSFKYKAQGAYSSTRYDTFSAVFRPTNGTDCSLWSTNVTKVQNLLLTVTVPLATYSGETGSLVLTYLHKGAVNTSSSYGGTLSDVMITNVVDVHNESRTTLVPQVLPALGMPEILSVSDVSEGFYGECWTNTTTFSVVCSETVEMLEARPSHLSLVRDEDVTVTKTGSGTFNVSITPSGVNEGNLRSRMILTLVGTDANGTKCYKDLSLRFSEVAQVISDVVVSASTSGGESYSVMVPYSWLEDNGLVPSGGDAAAHESALAPDADADSDGLPNWAEYVCGTDPSDADDKLTVSITMVGGEPVVTYTPDDGRIASGFKAVIKGTSDLAAAFSTWEIVTETRTSTCRFFRVEIVPEN